MELEPRDIIPKLEALIIGSEDFRTFEAKTDQFCPFEATGMVRQEIRHSHFLAFILDSNRPHEFGNLFLKEFLYLVAEGAMENSVYSKLDFHFMDIANLRVLREWKNIDILIEIETASATEKGLVIAIENKVDSGEHSGQLARYKEIMDSEYPDKFWHREFVFLTIDGTNPSENNTDIWQPIALGEVISRFEKVLLSHGFSGPSAETFKSYVSMLRRHILPNTELEAIARKIWSQHREALEALNAYAPNLNGEILTEFASQQSSMADEFSRVTGMKIVPEESSRTILRFAVERWDEFAELKSGDGSWVSSGRVFIIELAQWGKKQFRASLVIGPGNEQTRESLYQAVLADPKLSVGRRTATAKAKWKHLSSSIVLKEGAFEKAENDGKSATEILPSIIKNAASFLAKELPKYDSIVSELF